MNGLLFIREKLKGLYAEYDVFFRPVLKFALALVLFTVLNNWLGYLSILNSLFVIIILSVICAILPLNGTVVIGILLIVAHSFGLGLEVGAFSAIIYLLMVILYFRFVPQDALAILVTPLAYTLHVPALVPISLGLTRTPISAISAVLGVVSWRYVQILHDTIEPLKNSSASLLDVLQQMPKALLSKELIVEVITVVAVVLIVTVVRKLVQTYSWEIAIILGGLVYMGLSIAGGRILETNVNIPRLVLGTLASMAVCFVLEFFIFAAKYRESEYFQFEDDRFYYFVKAVPKLSAQAETDVDLSDEGMGQGIWPADGMTELAANDEDDDEPVIEPEQGDDIDFETKLEDSLRDL